MRRLDECAKCKRRRNDAETTHLKNRLIRDGRSNDAAMRRLRIGHLWAWHQPHARPFAVEIHPAYIDMSRAADREGIKKTFPYPLLDTQQIIVAMFYVCYASYGKLRPMAVE
jgi:hypothetical protein